MFLKPKTTQLNEEAIFYKRCIDITNYANADGVYRTLLSNGTYKYWYYDKNLNEMVEIQQPTTDNITTISPNKTYVFGNKMFIAFVNDTWQYSHSNISQVEYKNQFYWNDKNLNAENRTWLENQFASYEPLITQYLQDNYVNFNNGREYGLSFIFTIGDNTFDLTICPYDDVLYANGTYYYENSNWYDDDYSSFNGEITDMQVELYYNDGDYKITDTTFYKTLPAYDEFIAMIVNENVVRESTETLSVAGINKQQRSYFLNNGFFNYTYVSDISKVEQQYIKGLNVEYKTFDIKTDSDMSFSEEDIIQINDELYIISNIMYKTIRLPKPIKYTLFTCTILKK